jgi:hypothetical protein
MTKPIEKLDLDSMQAGPEMDALVGRNVMGLEIEYPNKIHPDLPYFADHTRLVDRAYAASHRRGLPLLADHDEKNFAEYRSLPRYSTDIAAAWEVAQSRDGWWDLMRHNDGMWRCYIDPWRSASGETAPLAICRAFLKYATILDSIPETT